MTKVYLDNNILIYLESEKYSIEYFQHLLRSSDIHFPYSQAHAFEWLELRDKGLTSKTDFLQKRFETIRKVCQNEYLYRDYSTGNDQTIIRDPEDAFHDISSSPVGLAAIRVLSNLVSSAQIEQIRAQLGIDPKLINNIPSEDVVEHLNTKLAVWQHQYSFVELIEHAESYFPNGRSMGPYERFAAYFSFLDMLGYWKEPAHRQVKRCPPLGLRPCLFCIQLRVFYQ